MDGVHIHVYQWQGQFVHVEITAWLDPAADMRLVIEPSGIGSTDEGKARAFLDPSIRTALRELHTSDGDVTLDTRGLSVRTKTMNEPSSFGAAVDRIAAVARKLHDQAGPYR